MATLKASGSPRGRVQTGDAVLIAARTTETGPVRQRLARFERVHEAYTRAQEQVEAAETEVRAAKDEAAARHADQGKEVLEVARGLVGDGQPLDNPFVTFAAPTPKALMRMPLA